MNRGEQVWETTGFLKWVQRTNIFYALDPLSPDKCRYVIRPRPIEILGYELIRVDVGERVLAIASSLSIAYLQWRALTRIIEHYADLLHAATDNGVPYLCSKNDAFQMKQVLGSINVVAADSAV